MPAEAEVRRRGEDDLPNAHELRLVMRTAGEFRPTSGERRHDSRGHQAEQRPPADSRGPRRSVRFSHGQSVPHNVALTWPNARSRPDSPASRHTMSVRDRKSTRLNSSHVRISYAVFCLKKKNQD